MSGTTQSTGGTQRGRGTHPLTRREEGDVRTEETEKTRGAHRLEGTETEKSQDTEGNRVKRGHSRTGENKEGDKSENRKNACESKTLTVRGWKRVEGRDKSGYQNTENKGGTGQGSKRR
jgi:hypothetical protein